MQIKSKDIRIITSDRNITIIYGDYTKKITPLRGTISADLMENHWWLSRALIQPPEARGKGIGSKMLQTLITEINKSVCKRIIVTPGGYDGNTRKQFNFYIKNGFKSIGKKTLEYNGNITINNKSIIANKHKSIAANKPEVKAKKYHTYLKNKKLRKEY